MKKYRDEVVVLLHGIGEPKWNMFGLEISLRKAGYRVANYQYPSLRKDLRNLARFIHQRLKADKIWEKHGTIHFVTHSMGGLVVRQYLAMYQSDIKSGKLGQVVMLAPPNGGSEVADHFKHYLPYKWIMGPAGQELATTSIWQKQQAAIDIYYNLGIIAGRIGWLYPIGQYMLRGPHDGRVTVEKTKLLGMKDHIVMVAAHSMISWQINVHRQVIFFLQNKNFDHTVNI